MRVDFSSFAYSFCCAMFCADSFIDHECSVEDDGYASSDEDDNAQQDDCDLTDFIQDDIDDNDGDYTMYRQFDNENKWTERRQTLN